MVEVGSRDSASTRAGVVVVAEVEDLVRDVARERAPVESEEVAVMLVLVLALVLEYADSQLVTTARVSGSGSIASQARAKAAAAADATAADGECTLSGDLTIKLRLLLAVAGSVVVADEVLWRRVRWKTRATAAAPATRKIGYGEADDSASPGGQGSRVGAIRGGDVMAAAEVFTMLSEITYDGGLFDHMLALLATGKLSCCLSDDGVDGDDDGCNVPSGGLREMLSQMMRRWNRVILSGFIVKPKNIN